MSISKSVIYQTVWIGTSSTEAFSNDRVDTLDGLATNVIAVAKA